MKARTEFDLSKSDLASAFKYGYMDYSVKTSKGDMGIKAGKWLHAAQFNWDGPQGNRHLGWPTAEGNIPCYGTGVQFYTHAAYDLYIENTRNADGEKMWSGMISWEGTSVYAYEDLGWGAVNRIEFASWLHTGIGLGVFDNDDNVAWYEYYGDFGAWRLTVLADHNLETNKINCSASVNYEFAPHTGIVFGGEQVRGDDGSSKWEMTTAVNFSY